MSKFPDGPVLDQAIAWHLRLRDADNDAWREFTDWLTANPAHNDAYEAVVDEEARLEPILHDAGFLVTQEETGTQEAAPAILEPIAVEPLPARATRPGRFWRWGSIAASVAIAGALAVQFMPRGDSTYTVETALGQTRTIALADGSEIALNGGTQIVFDRDNERTATLLSGEARFSVEHDDKAPFTVFAGDRRLVDIGTVFNVERTQEKLHVAVAEGAVRYEGVSRNIELDAGDALTTDHTGNITLTRQPADSIGSWTRGVLVYDAAPLAEVGTDLSRSLGVTIAMPQELRTRPFSGVIQTDGGAPAVRERLEPLLGVTIEADGSSWRMRP